MEGKKIGIATVYTGFNYGSALQAFATKSILASMGYHGEILKLSGSLLPGRDVRLKKLMTVGVRSMLHSGGMKSLKNYGDSIKKPLSGESTAMFRQFADFRLRPREVKYKQLKKLKLKPEEQIRRLKMSLVWAYVVLAVALVAFGITACMLLRILDQQQQPAAQTDETMGKNYTVQTDH